MEAKPGDKPANMEGEDLDASPAQSDTAQPAETGGKEPDKKSDDKDKKSEPAGGGESLLARIRGWKYLYLLLFFILLVIVGASVGVALILGKNTNKETQPQELSADQLAELGGATTVVGDATQILSIRSSTIFEGQVLAKKDLSVAGSLKVGGLLSIPSIDVGSGAFDQLQIDTDLVVGGNQNIQGNLSVQGSLTIGGASSFKKLSVDSLTASSLQLGGNLTINRHLVASGGSPSKSNGSALGGGGTASVNGSDTAGTININTGNSPSAGCFISVVFANDFNGTPAVVVSPVGSSSGALSYYTNRSSNSFSLCSANTPAAGTNYTFDYIVIN